MKRYIIVLASLLCLFWLAGTCSFAFSVSMSGFENYDYNGDLYDFLQQTMKEATGYNFDDENIPLGSTSNADKFTTFLNRLSSDSYQEFCFTLRKLTGSQYANQTSPYNYIAITYGNTGSSRHYGGYIYLAYNSGNPYVICGGELGGTGATSSFTFSSTLSSDNLAKFYINKNNSNIRANQKWYKSISNTINITSSLKYTSNKTQLFTVNSSNGSYTMYKADYNLNGTINIGYLSSYKNYDQLNGYLGVFSGFNNTDNASYYDTIATFQYNKINNTQLKNNLRLDYDTGQVYINSSSLSYNHAYSLYFTGDGSDTTTVVNYYFVPYGSTATSGDINTDNPTGLDFDFINSIESNSGNTEYIINNEFVNSSGDLFGIVYNDRDNWGFGDFVGSTINGIYNALFNYDNVTMDFGFLGQHSSSELTTPSDNALIVIASLFCNSFLLIGAVSWFWRSILAISTLSVDKFIKDDEDLVLF